MQNYCLEKVIECYRLAAPGSAMRQGRTRMKEKKWFMGCGSAFLLQLCHVEDSAGYLLPCTVTIVSWIIIKRNIPGCITSHLLTNIPDRNNPINVYNLSHNLVSSCSCYINSAWFIHNLYTDSYSQTSASFIVQCTVESFPFIYQVKHDTDIFVPFVT